jgi:3-isopropylmalate/(R)-2-methylmalate dehydratase small subunit
MVTCWRRNVGMNTLNKVRYCHSGIKQSVTAKLSFRLHPKQNQNMKITAIPFVLTQENIDTDQIIPARFLTTTTRAGLGQFAFYDWRYDANGIAKPEFALNASHIERILVTGKNFGCGSSREHAPWALLDAGIRAVIASEIADIFRNNALKNGLVPCVIAPHLHQQLLAELAAKPDATLTIDVDCAEVIFPSTTRASFEIAPFAKHCLLNGVDELGYLLAQEPAISAFEAARR